MSRSSRRKLFAVLGPLVIAGGAAGVIAPLIAADAPPAPAVRRPDDAAVRKAVDRGLEFLARIQAPDGSFPSGFAGASGVTSVALLAFLAAGHTPGRGPYGEAIDRGVRWILAGAGPDGFLAPAGAYRAMYSHGIGALLLGEVAGMVDENRPGFETLRKVHERAIDLILRAQAVAKPPPAAGGWRYLPDSVDSDISASGWQLMALRAAQDNGIPVPKRSIEAAVAYILRCSVPDGFGYQPAGPSSFGRIGTGVLGLQLCGQFASPEAVRGGDILLRTEIRFEGKYFHYGIYYATQGMYQLGGKYWEGWRPRAESLLLARQAPDGSWAATADGAPEETAGKAYTTGMAIQTLAVPFRFLPIYQR